jgi:hypothetical protein
VVMHRGGRYNTEDVHAALFPQDGSPWPVVSTRNAIREHIRRKHGSLARFDAEEESADVSDGNRRQAMDKLVRATEEAGGYDL